jgi:hypothetical protein
MADMGPSDEELDQEFLRSIDHLGVLLPEKRFVEAVEFLRSVIARQQDLEMRLVYMRNLATVLTLSGQDAESLAVMRERTDLAPDEPHVWCDLALHLHIHKSADSTVGQANEIEALETIDHAVAVAQRIGGTDLRSCLNDRARIAKAIGRWDVVEDSIRRVLAIPDGRGVPDAAVEVDFLRKIPPGAVDPDLIERSLKEHAAAVARRNARPD